MRRLAGVLALLLGLSGSGMVSATLIDRGHGLIYDDVLDITWLQNANLGAGSPFDNGISAVDGLMTWGYAVDWADQLVFGGFDDWRLPSMDVNGDQSTTGNGQGVVDCKTATETDCRDNELGYMFYYNFDGTFNDDLTGDQTANGVTIQGIQYLYWSGTGYPLGPGCAWAAQFANGDQFCDFDLIDNGAWAVRLGDVLAVPEPSMGLLLVVGSAGLGWCRRSARPRPG